MIFTDFLFDSQTVATRGVLSLWCISWTFEAAHSPCSEKLLVDIWIFHENNQKTHLKTRNEYEFEKIKQEQ